MATEKQKQKRVERWRNKFRLVILNDDTFEELLTLRLSPLNVFTFSVFAIVFTIAITSIVIAFTPLKELVPGYASSKIRRQAIELSLKQTVWKVFCDRTNVMLAEFSAFCKGR